MREVSASQAVCHLKIAPAIGLEHQAPTLIDIHDLAMPDRTPEMVIRASAVLRDVFFEKWCLVPDMRAVLLAAENYVLCNSSPQSRRTDRVVARVSTNTIPGMAKASSDMAPRDELYFAGGAGD